MPVETEIKLCVADLECIARKLKGLEANPLSPRHFEDNFVFDFPGGRIRARRCLVRLRLTDIAAVLTFKDVPHSDGPFKTREEIETVVADGQAAMRILEGIGMKVWFRYQKFRREFGLNPGLQAGDEIHVALDETPIGTFVELEGSEAGIRAAAGKLGYAETGFIRESYYTLYVRSCQVQGIPVGHMVYADRKDVSWRRST